jgi:hypothetical protein
VPSTSLNYWDTTRAAELDEIEQAHAAVGGTGRGRRYTTQQINRAFAMLLASQFQGFCRDLHSECVDHVLGVLAPPAPLRNLLRAEFTRSRQLDRGNAQSASLGADFSRLGIELWDELRAYDPASNGWRNDLDLLNDWRNAIAHQDFASLRLRGVVTIQVGAVRRWRTSCGRLALAVDNVMWSYLQTLTGVSPW